MGLFEIIAKGGILMVPILFCSALALAVFLERTYYFFGARIDAGRLMGIVRTALEEGDPKRAIQVCEKAPGPVAKCLRAVLLAAGRPREEIKEHIDEVVLHEVPRLEKRLVVLSTVAHITPLLGLLGTVSGMIQAFQTIQAEGGMVNPGDLARGIWEALITTGAGLVVAIPTFVAYSYLVSRADAIVLDMERCATSLLNLLKGRRSGSQ